MTPGFALISVATYLTLVGADDLQELNCTDNVGYLCSDYRDDLQDTAHIPRHMYNTVVGFSVGTFIFIAVLILVCVFCACCPGYNYIQKGTAYPSATTQQQPVTVYQVPPYSPQKINTQTSVPPPYPGFVYSHGHTSPQTPNAPYYSAVDEHQINPGIGHYAGAPEQPPPYSETSPPNQSMNNNFTSK